MGRRAKPTKGKVEDKRPLVRKAPTKGAARVQELEKRLAESLEQEKTTGALLQQKDRALTEALEQQTATSEILRVISSSPTDVQPVLNAVVESAVRLCAAYDARIWRLKGDHLVRVAGTGELLDDSRQSLPLDPAVPSAVAFFERRTVHLDETRWRERFETNPRFGIRSVISTPLMREGQPIGVLAVRSQHLDGFTDKQVALLQTFADQAVIAIENVRLFTELQEKNQALTTAHAQVTEALEQQTATSEILRVISSSPTDLQPVFEAIASRVVRLCDAFFSTVWRYDGSFIHHAADNYPTEEMRAILTKGYPAPPRRESAVAQAISECRIIHIEDLLDVSAPVASRDVAIALGYRTVLCVPMLRDAVSIGALAVARREQQPFSDRQIELVKTFADQAVIAIENARLLSELQARTQELTRSVEQLTALGDVGRAVSSSLDLDTVLTTIVGRAVQLSGTDGGTIFEYDEATEEFAPRATLNADASQSAMLRTTRLRRGEGAVGQLAVTRTPIQIPDIAAEGAYESRLRGALLGAGTRALLAVPLLHEARLVGGLVVSRRTPGAFTAEVVEILRTFATQSALAIQNARLFHEIERKSRELEVASQHKSEFLASMSHELRTPLNAIIGFSDVLLEGMFGETNEKQTEYLRDILASGQHLLSLINDILDLSKIEAGRMELEVAAFDLPAAIDDTLLLMRDRAGRRGITLERHVDERVGEIHGDQRKVKQVLLNLLSNAAKFTPEGGRIDVRAALADGTAEISVTDTGIGIAAEDHAAVFEEFRQVGAAEKKAEGTGLGLALCQKFVELHGGRIWVKSQLGVGSTFTFTLPVRSGD